MSSAKVLTQWTRLGKFPFGRWFFSKMMGFTVPYAASIDARVETLSEGRALVRLDDRRAVRNHLKSIHAAARNDIVMTATQRWKIGTQAT